MALADWLRRGLRKGNATSIGGRLITLYSLYMYPGRSGIALGNNFEVGNMHARGSPVPVQEPPGAAAAAGASIARGRAWSAATER